MAIDIKTLQDEFNKSGKRAVAQFKRTAGSKTERIGRAYKPPTGTVITTKDLITREEIKGEKTTVVIEEKKLVSKPISILTIEELDPSKKKR